MSTASPTVSATESEQTASGIARWIERAALVLTLSLTVCRTSLLEFIRDPFPVTPGSDVVPAGPGPTTSLIFNALLLLPAVMLLVGWAIDRRNRLRGAGLTLLTVALGVMVVISAFRSDDRFSAAVDGANLIAALAVLWTTAQLTRSWKRLRLIAAVAAGVLMICLAHGGIDHWIELPARQESFRQNLPDMLRTMHVEPGTFEANRIVVKISSGELLGFGASVNTFAAVIVLCIVVTGGAAFQRWRDGDDPAVSVTLAILIALSGVVIAWTACRAAYATPIIAAALLAMYGCAGAWMNAHRRTLVVFSITLFAGTIAFIVHHGLATGTLFHDSLNFRWRYWVGAWGVWREQPLLGVGLDSFGAHYLAHRLPIASEEIKDPHNFLVHAFTEMGLVGGIITLAWFGTLLERMTWPATLIGSQVVEAVLPRDRRRRATQQAGEVTLSHLVGVATLASVFGIGMFTAFIANLDFAHLDWNIAIAAIERTLFFCAATLTAALVALRSLRDPTLDERPAPWIRAAMTAGVFVFVVHNLIDFAVFESSAMYIAAVVAGAAWGAGMRQSRSAEEPTRRDEQESIDPSESGAEATAPDGSGLNLGAPDRALPRAARLTVATVAAVGWLVVALAMIVPTALAESAAGDGDEALRHSQFPAAMRDFESALSQWPSNADYALRAAAALAYAGNPDRAAGRRLLDQAVATSPFTEKYRLARARFGLDTIAPPATILADYAAALVLDPNAVDVRLEYADTLARLNHPAQAIQEYEKAVAFNDELSPDEPKRMSEERLAQVRQQVAALRAGG